VSKYCVIETSIHRLSWVLRVAKYRGLIAEIKKKKTLHRRIYYNQLKNLYYSQKWLHILSEEHKLKLSNKERKNQKPQTYEFPLTVSLNNPISCQDCITSVIHE